jgi:hypothetical protein
MVLKLSSKKKTKTKILAATPTITTKQCSTAYHRNKAIGLPQREL